MPSVVNAADLPSSEDNEATFSPAPSEPPPTPSPAKLPPGVRLKDPPEANLLTSPTASSKMRPRKLLSQAPSNDKPKPNRPRGRPPGKRGAKGWGGRKGKRQGSSKVEPPSAKKVRAASLSAAKNIKEHSEEPIEEAVSLKTKKNISEADLRHAIKCVILQKFPNLKRKDWGEVKKTVADFLNTDRRIVLGVIERMAECADADVRQRRKGGGSKPRIKPGTVEAARLIDGLRSGLGCRNTATKINELGVSPNKVPVSKSTVARAAKKSFGMVWANRQGGKEKLWDGLGESADHQDRKPRQEVCVGESETGHHDTIQGRHEDEEVLINGQSLR